MLASAFLALIQAAAPPPAPPPAPPVRWQFCVATGAHPVVVVATKGTKVDVRVAPLVIEVSERAPRIRFPRHVDERWPITTVAASCLGELPPSLGDTAGHTVELLGQPELVFGCGMDSVGAVFTEEKLDTLARRPAPSAPTCVRHVDVRPACMPSTDGDDASDPMLSPQQRLLDAQNKQLLAALTPRFSLDGPAVTVRARGQNGSARLYLIERLLESEVCGCSEDVANVISSRAVVLQLPRLPVQKSGPGPEARLWIAVPRYTGASYDLVLTDHADDVDADAITRLPYTDPFVTAAPDDAQTVRAFSAPLACPCDCPHEAID